MSVIYIVLPLAFLFAGLAVWAFILAVKGGQLDDLDTPAARILLDDDDPAGVCRSPTEKSGENLLDPPNAETRSQPAEDAR